MTEEIRGQLSQISALRLLSRNGLDSYKDDAMRAVRELGLRHLVDGSVRVDGNRVRVSAELVDASTQQTLWSDRYDRDLADVLTVQSQIAQQIAHALQANLSPAEQRRIEKRPTSNLDAYTRFLQAQQANTSDRARNLEAIEQLRQALALDPQFALARGHLAYRLLFLASYDGPSYLDQAITEAEAAVKIDPSLSYGHFALGTAYGRKGLGAQSRQAFHRALELDPNNTSAMNNFSNATRFTDPGKVETREYDAVRFLCAVAGVDGSKSLMAKGEKLVSRRGIDKKKRKLTPAFGSGDTPEDILLRLVGRPGIEPGTP
jgi:adenylate cyclase